jgi:hypothetical protein
VLKKIVPLAALLSSACAFQNQVNRASVDYDQAVGRAADELTLLNVVRAMNRYPLHFTTIAKISGSFKVTGRAGLGVDINQNGGSSTFGAGNALTGRTASIGPDKFSPSIGAEVSAGPSFDIGVLDTQDFYNGILASIDAPTIGNFLNLGWPDDLVAAMVIERVEFHVARHAAGKAAPTALATSLEPGDRDGEEAVWIVDNKPGSPEFGQFLRCFQFRPSVRNNQPIRLWPVAGMDKIKPADLQPLDGEKLGLSEEPVQADRYVQRMRPPTKGLTFRVRPSREISLSLPQCSFALSAEDGRDPLKVSVDLSPDRAAAAKAPVDAQHNGTGGLAVQLTGPGDQEKRERAEVDATMYIVLRSAQAVLYFLGEYARQEHPYLLRDNQRVINVRVGHEAAAFLSARLNGVPYYIPGDQREQGRSATAIDLAQQLINLNKSAKDKPETTSLRIID